jgi:hypothetical protein
MAIAKASRLSAYTDKQYVPEISSEGVMVVKASVLTMTRLATHKTAFGVVPAKGNVLSMEILCYDIHSAFGTRVVSLQQLDAGRW